MNWSTLLSVLSIIQHFISVIGVLIIFFGVLLSLGQFIFYVLSGQVFVNGDLINHVRLGLGRILLLGLEFIVSADLIGSITTPDYYSLGILAIIVIIRTILSYTINREITMLTEEERPLVTNK